MDSVQIPASMDKHLDVLKVHASGGVLVGASSLTGRYWLGSLWYYTNPDLAPDVDKCTAGVQLEAGLRDAAWVDAQKVLVGLDTGGVALWELQDEDKVFSMLSSACEHDNMTSSVSVSCDLSRFLSASYDHGIKVWNPDLTSLHTYQAHSDIVWDVHCHPTEPDLFLSCSQDGKIVLWDIRDRKPAACLRKCSSGSLPTCVQWQPGARNMYAVGYEEGQVSVQDLRIVVEKTVTYHPHNRPVNRLAFCPQKPSMLATVSEDSKATVTSITSSTSSLLYESSGHTDFVYGLTWASDSQFLTSGWDGKILRHMVTNAQINGNTGVEMNGDIGESEPVEVDVAEPVVENDAS
ncbi:methylosome protein WDR77-like [Babylonia areolata]|uniref:methylosome protein WDR77-like n=1 Tax=Babylonia areolata TaxID=304850 RepID=UPI003FD5DD7E